MQSVPMADMKFHLPSPSLAASAVGRGGASELAHSQDGRHASTQLAQPAPAVTQYKRAVTQTQTFTPLRVAFAPSIVPFKRMAVLLGDGRTLRRERARERTSRFNRRGN